MAWHGMAVKNINKIQDVSALSLILFLISFVNSYSYSFSRRTDLAFSHHPSSQIGALRLGIRASRNTVTMTHFQSQKSFLSVLLRCEGLLGAYGPYMS